MIAVIDYGMGNIGSVLNMLMRLGVTARITSSKADVDTAEKIILPGVGRFDQGMKNLAESGLRGILEKRVIDQGVPILGICLGMQLFSRRSEEGALEGLGWIDAETVRFRFDASAVKLRVPHMGWNSLEKRTDHSFTRNLFEMADLRFYFAHSYHIECHFERNVLAETIHGYAFPSVICKDNILGVQFHPEKSHRYGLALIKNFTEMAGC